MNCCLTCCDSMTIATWEHCFMPKPRDIDEVAPQLQSGDLFLATACPAGRLAGQYTIGACPWDHAGIIWREGDEVYIIDSCGSRYFPNIVKRPLYFGDGAAPAGSAWLKEVNGPQMMPLKGFIEATRKGPIEGVDSNPDKIWWNSRMGVRPLAKPLSPSELAKLRASIESMADRPYQKDSDVKGEAINAAVDICDCIGLTANKRESRESLFCSEMVAAAYTDVGLLPQSKFSSEYVPSDFSPYSGSNLSGLCGCCCLSHALGHCGIGDIQRIASSEGGAGRLFAEEIVLATGEPPMATRVHPSARNRKVAPAPTDMSR